MGVEFTISQLFVLGAFGALCGVVVFRMASTIPVPLRVFMAAGALFIPFILVNVGQALSV